MSAINLSRYEKAIDSFDAVNSGDPRIDVVNGHPEPRELVYARRMSETLEEFLPGASEPLRLAVRAQHIGRWTIPRTEYPEGKQGYREWRTRLMDFHALTADSLLVEAGYEEEVRNRVASLIRKERIKLDPEAQALEDVACLVFLRYYLDEFIVEHDDDKLIGIFRKTWAKMSEAGRAAALTLGVKGRAADLLARALEGKETGVRGGGGVRSASDDAGGVDGPPRGGGGVRPASDDAGTMGSPAQGGDARAGDAS